MKYDTLIYRFLREVACDRKPTLDGIFPGREWDRQYSAGNINAIGNICESLGFVTYYNPQHADQLTEAGWEYLLSNSAPNWLALEQLESTDAG